MKRMMKVAFIVLMAGTLVGCGNNGSSNMDNIIEDKYDEILSKITVSIENEEESESGEFSYMYPRYGARGTSDFGYAYIQINENEKVLVVGENGTEQYPSILYDMYEVKNEELVHIFSGGERDRYYATDTTGAFIEEGSSSAEESFYDVFSVKDGERKSTEFFVEPVKINIELMPLTSQESSEKQNGKAHSIEVIDAKEVIKKCPKSAKAGNKVTIKTNCFMDAIPKINVNGNDIGEWDGNRTEYTFIMPDEDIEITTTLKSASDF